LDPALTVAQQRMNTQGGAKRRRGPAKKEGDASKQRCAPPSQAMPGLSQAPFSA